MLYDAQGRPIGQAEGVGRKGATVDAYQMPDGAIVDMARSMVLHQMIRDNKNGLRDRLVQADKEQAEFLAKRGIGNGKKLETLHLAVLRHDKDKPEDKVIDGIKKNMQFGEEVQAKRIKEQETDLTNTIKAVQA